MPYAIYSKKTKKVSKLVHSLSSILPSEGAIEVSDDISFSRDTWIRVFGQDITGQSVKLFDSGGGVITVSPFRRGNRADGSPYKIRNTPVVIEPLTDPGGNPVSFKRPLPIYAAPHSWNRWALLSAKYEAVLARNGTYHAIVGEEFDNDKHIDPSSSGFTILGNSCIISPGGIVKSSTFTFGVNVANPVADSQFVFDTYYFATQPELSPGIEATWGGSNTAGTDPAAEPLFLNDETPTTMGTESSAAQMSSMFVQFKNTTNVPFTLENYTLFVRARSY